MIDEQKLYNYCVFCANYESRLCESCTTEDQQTPSNYKSDDNLTRTKFKAFKRMTLDQFAEWLNKFGQFDKSPWMEWWDRTYCKHCDPIMCKYSDYAIEFPCSWCELNDNKCKFFPKLEDMPDNKEIIKMWLQTEA